MSDSHPGLVRRVLSWLRAGYPDGVPQTDHVALMGVLHRTLSDAEVRAIADRLASEDVGMLSREQVADCIERRAHEKATEADIDRVSARLVAAGLGIARDRTESDAPAAPAADR